MEFGVLNIFVGFLVVFGMSCGGGIARNAAPVAAAKVPLLAAPLLQAKKSTIGVFLQRYEAISFSLVRVIALPVAHRKM